LKQENICWPPEKRRTTWGLAILGLDIVSFNILSLSAFVPAGRSLLSFSSYHQLLIINLASVPGGRFSKPQHRQALDVVRKPDRLNIL